MRASPHLDRPAPSLPPLWRRGIAALIAVALLSSACQPATPPTGAPIVATSTTAPAPRVMALRGDGRAVELTREPADTGLELGRDQAVAAARVGLPPDADSAAAEASLTLLSIRASDDGALALDRRRVWLVRFPGVAFAAGDACACEGGPTRPDTVVAVDAADGSVLASFGVS